MHGLANTVFNLFRRRRRRRWMRRKRRKIVKGREEMKEGKRK